jgi:alpha-tubulin suppressor-like RCC1 family protein
MTRVGLTVALAFCGLTAARAFAMQDPPALAMRVSAGGLHTCAIASDGQTICWGDNREGQSGGQPGGAVAVHTLPGPRLVEIAAGGQHTCGLDEQGGAWCWGDNKFGQLGNGALTRRVEPTPVRGDRRFIAITAGENHTCALTHDGQAWCWGDQWDRAAGAFRAGDNLTEPFPVKGDVVFEFVEAGGRHTCGVSRDRRVWCWGNNNHRQSAPSTQWDVVDYPLPVDVPPAINVQAGETYSCALATGGSVHCWGSLRADSSSAPAPTPEGGVFVQIAAGRRHVCGRTTAGSTLCWGDNRTHQAGSTAAIWIDDPTMAPTAVTFDSVSAGGTHTCGVDSSRRIFCWGDNAHGQLGRPGPSSSTPVPIHGEASHEDR